MNFMPIDKLLPKLKKVKSGKTGQWSACCPAHDDKTPSLSITETSDGVVLLKCWAGCTAKEIVFSVGLDLRDLFPSSTGRSQPAGPNRSSIELEKVLYHIGESLISSGFPLSDADLARFDLAKKRLGGML